MSLVFSFVAGGATYWAFNKYAKTRVTEWINAQIAKIGAP